MALGNCRECGKQVSTEAKACPNCGAKAPVRKPRRWLWVLGGLLLLGALVRPASKVGTDQEVKSNAVAMSPQVKSKPTKVLPSECLVRKANGLLDERERDLVELCKDRAFFTKRLAKY